MSDWRTEITVFEKARGPLTKQIELRDGRLVNDSSACLMANGSARRVAIDSMQALADLINNFASNQAYALGRLKDGVPDRVRVVTADKLNGAGNPSVIARTKDYLVFKDGPGFTLLDADFKGMSVDAKRRMEECGGLWGALCEVLPALETVAYVERASTSSGLRNKETGETFADSGGRHIVILVLDATDIPRFLSDFHDRCWLAGFGWGMVSAAGSFLERSIIDKSVGSPERLVFEAAPIVVPPLEQLGRNAVAHDGAVLDTRLCAPLTDAEKAKLQKLIDAEELRLLPERQQKRAAWSVTHIRRLIARGMSESDARKQVDRWIDQKELSGDFQLPFDDPKLAGTTVADVLADPERFIHKTLADPHEGPDYGRGKAIIYRRNNGSLFIHSFAHGGMIYELKNERKDEPFRQTSAQFIADFVPPDYLLNGVLIRRFLYSFTGRTGSGKTAVVLLFAASIALERKIGELEVAPGRVFYFCGENPDDVRMRWIALAQQMDFDPDTIDVHFFPGRFKISEMRERIIAEAQTVGGVVLIIVDTSAAYFEGDDPNNNAQQAVHARRLRTLTELPGGPCVLVNCHPVKNAAPDNLIPYGGGAFLNEVDGNLTCAIDGVAIEVSWQGKFRGPDFAPLIFKVRSVTHERLKDSRGRLIPTVIAEHLSETAQQEMAKVARSDEDKLLAEIDRDGFASRADYAERCGWALKTGDPHKTLVKRTLDKLKEHKLITPDRGGWALTEKGRKALGSDKTSKTDKPVTTRVLRNAGVNATCAQCREGDKPNNPVMMISGRAGDAIGEPLHAECSKVYWAHRRNTPRF